MSLLGRADECALLDGLIDDIRLGKSRSLVLRGEAGIGKTVLLTHLIESAPDLTVVRAVGVESEMELAFASLHQLCGPLLDRLEDREAIERLGRSRVRPLLARTQLVYGEWLRREQRRVDARVQLGAAHDQFTSIGMEAFAERARRELEATGATVRKRTVETRDDLTAQERQIARLARDGLSNPEIGTRLFLSPRTVEWHLHKVFTKLEIRSRHELSGALPSSESELAPA